MFDPIHTGHLNCANQAARLLGLDRVYFIPTAVPPHKRRKGASPEARMEMVRRAVRGNALFKVSRIEMGRTAPSYTIDTVRRFKKRGLGQLHFILGLDAFVELPGWKDAGELLRSCNFIVMPRPGSGVAAAADELARRFKGALAPAGPARGGIGAVLRASGSPFRIYLCQIPEMDISSTDIRRRAGAGKSIKYLVPKAVEQYIINEGLYI